MFFFFFCQTKQPILYSKTVFLNHSNFKNVWLSTARIPQYDIRSIINKTTTLKPIGTKRINTKTENTGRNQTLKKLKSLEHSMVPGRRSLCIQRIVYFSVVCLIEIKKIALGFCAWFSELHKCNTRFHRAQRDLFPGSIDRVRKPH